MPNQRDSSLHHSVAGALTPCALFAYLAVKAPTN
jgi:hypothetical protein